MAGAVTHMRRIAEVVVVALLFGRCSFLVLGASSKVVNVALQPRWNHTSLLLEAGYDLVHS